MRHLLPPLLSLALLAAGCSGGGSSSPTPSAPAITATTTPTNAPTAIPTAASTATPVPLSLKIINGAPLASTPVVLSKGRRAQSQGIAASGLPILVESAGAYVLSAGPQVSWVTDLVGGKDVAETSGTVTAPGFAIDSPTLAAQSCIGALTPWCAAHPLAWTWGTDAVKPVGKQTLTIGFGDGTSATTSDYVYDGWSLTCGTGWVYSGGVIVPTTTRAASDVYEDCVAGNIVFPKAATLIASPTPDPFGRYETILPLITGATFFAFDFVNVPIVSIAQGQVYGVQTTDGGSAKVYFANATQGLALHAQSDGTYAY